MDKSIEHKIGQVVEARELDKDGGVPRLVGKRFKVVVGSSCTQCAMAGLGHVVCPAVACSYYDRSDGHSVVYEEQDDDS